MTGFDTLEPRRLPKGASRSRARKELGLDAIQLIVARADSRRSRELGEWLKRRAREWASLWRRSGRAIPDSYRSSKAHS